MLEGPAGLASNHLYHLSARSDSAMLQMTIDSNTMNKSTAQHQVQSSLLGNLGFLMSVTNNSYREIPPWKAPPQFASSFMLPVKDTRWCRGGKDVHCLLKPNKLDSSTKEALAKSPSPAHVEPTCLLKNPTPPKYLIACNASLFSSSISCSTSYFHKLAIAPL